MHVALEKEVLSFERLSVFLPRFWARNSDRLNLRSTYGSNPAAQPAFSLGISLSSGMRFHDPAARWC